MPDATPASAGRTADADLDRMIARAETCCATYFRALAAATNGRDTRLLRGLLHLEEEALAELRARRDRLHHSP